MVRRPPVHERSGADDLRLGGELSAAPRCDLAVLVDVDEVPIRQAFAEQGPKPFGGLDIRRVRRLDDQMDPLRDDHSGCRVPASTVNDEYDSQVWSRPDFLREHAKCSGGALSRNRCRDEPFCPTGGRMHEAPDVVPLVAAAGARHGSSPNRSPGATRGREEARARLTLAPDLYAGSRMLTYNLLDTTFEPPFLKASTASRSLSGCA